MAKPFLIVVQIDNGKEQTFQDWIKIESPMFDLDSMFLGMALMSGISEDDLNFYEDDTSSKYNTYFITAISNIHDASPLIRDLPADAI